MTAAHTPTCVIVQRRPGALARVREWAQFLADHRTEALARVRVENVSIESVFLRESPDGDCLVYHMRCASLAHAQAAARQSHRGDRSLPPRVQTRHLGCGDARSNCWSI